jgi:flagellin-like hook-associated protein FlgL
MTMLRSLAAANHLRVTSVGQLSTGRRINAASDDPAGLMAVEPLQREVASVDRNLAGSASEILRNATADTALKETQILLIQIRGAFSIAANSGATSQDELEARQMAVDAAVASLDRIAEGTTFKGKALLDGSEGGFSASSVDLGDPALGNVASLAGGGDNALAGGNRERGVAIVTAALNQVSRERGRLGAQQVAALEPAMRSLGKTQGELSAAAGALGDVDYAAAHAEALRGSLIQRAAIGSLKASVQASGRMLDLRG